jgi:hypothetical protein
VGKFIYGIPSVEVELDDRVLAHLKTVITAKLRRNEGFTFTWANTDDGDTTHSSVWLDEGIPISFEIGGKGDPPLNRQWLEELAKSANSTAGLKIVPEPEAAEK